LGVAQVWISFARFEEEAGGADAAALIYREADEHFRDTGQKEERTLALEAWMDAEKATGDRDCVDVVAARMPKKLKKKRPVRDDAGDEVGWEEYFEYTFPEEEVKAPSLKILEMAHKWKKQKTDE
jgi:crooked neck